MSMDVPLPTSIPPVPPLSLCAVIRQVQVQHWSLSQLSGTTANPAWALSLHCSAASDATPSPFVKPSAGKVWIWGWDLAGEQESTAPAWLLCARVIDDGLGWCWALLWCALGAVVWNGAGDRGTGRGRAVCNDSSAIETLWS